MRLFLAKFLYLKAVFLEYWCIQQFAKMSQEEYLKYLKDTYGKHGFTFVVKPPEPKPPPPTLFVQSTPKEKS